MGEKDIKFMNMWSNKRKRGGVFFIIFRTIFTSITAFILLIIFEYTTSGRDYFNSEQFQGKILLLIAIPMIISFSGAINEWRRNERRYHLLVAEKNRINNKS